ncbi:glycosyltransferase family 22 protein [Paxillus involutus ATCC 200175]|uniref:Mannosyltransferase n=1 Tax=Paxillus involutus ATCC 200175 TaxID=664439 RepID=A0A0C9TZX9_PAXIN|nr:glycosyltransferase family 22 protein [Paxillus involutus ATCC 200175]
MGTSGLVVDFLLLAASWTHVLLAPYSKVEESFNLHAIHDALMYGTGPGNLHNFDHNVFPGAVPRTFTGSIMLAWITEPFVYLGTHLGLITSKFDLQIALRLSLAALNAIALILVRRAVSTRFGRRTSWLFALLTCSQFHLPFWMGRTLPNMFALIPVNIAYYALYNRAPKSLQASKRSINTALTLLTFTSVVFRSEVALLLAPLALQLLVQGHITFLNLIKVGPLAGLTSVAITVAVDSYFWAQWPLWPELYGVYFNVYLGKSADWGISPVHTYFTAYLPKLLLSSSLLSVLGATLDYRIRSMLCAPVMFVLTLSALGHKEWRFVIYVVPLFNIAAARGTLWMTSRKKGFLFKHISFLCALSLIALNFIVTLTSTRASMANYPGGVALAAFNERYAGQKNIHLHISNLAAQTGASLFLHEHAPPIFMFPFLVSSPSPIDASWTYNKTESLTPSMIASSSFTHLIAESHEVGNEEWKVVQSIHGFKRWKLNMNVLNKLKTGKLWEVSFGECARVLEMEVTEQLWILERSGE